MRVQFKDRQDVILFTVAYKHFIIIFSHFHTIFLFNNKGVSHYYLKILDCNNHFQLIIASQDKSNGFRILLIFPLIFKGVVKSHIYFVLKILQIVEEELKRRLATEKKQAAKLTEVTEKPKLAGIRLHAAENGPQKVNLLVLDNFSPFFNFKSFHKCL